MMIDYPPEIIKLTEETDPWLAFDPVKEHGYIRDDAPQSIKDKYDRLQKLTEKLFAPYKKAGWM